MDIPALVIDDRDVTLEQLMDVALAGRPVRLSGDAAWLAKLNRGRAILEQSLSAGERIYGVSTSVGYSSG